ncbi:MAG: hypothetical protein JSR47_11090 [Proteobacteria bacterium]|nr:hypothetical protein [Pseudomonadota bacterium]
MTRKLYLLALVAPCLAACSLPTNVAIKRIDSLRAEQDTCLKNNVSQFDDHGGDAQQVGRFVAMSCTTQTEKLVQYAVPNASREEYQAFKNDAAVRATGYVRYARGQAPTPQAYQPASGAPQAL